MKVPKYQLVQNELRQQIISGKFENGDKFYTEAELTKLYNVSSITVIRAMNELVNKDPNSSTRKGDLRLPFPQRKISQVLGYRDFFNR